MASEIQNKLKTSPLFKEKYETTENTETACGGLRKASFCSRA
jgi:hypothetical protein